MTPQKEFVLYKPQSIALQKLLTTDKDKGIVSLPTGVGKTKLAMVWFREMLNKNPSAKLLYLTHNYDILQQARDDEFEEGLKDFKLSFGYYTGRIKEQNQCTFATIQTLSRNLNKYTPKYFDYIIYDEAHHAQALTYRQVISHFKPKFMLSLTATPFRADNRNIFKICGDVISDYKITDAIADGLLTKLDYYFVDNDIDFNKIKWTGYRYPEKYLNKHYCIPEFDAAIMLEFKKYVIDKHHKKKIICFCPTIMHAHRLKRLFTENGFNAVAYVSKTDIYQTENKVGSAVKPQEQQEILDGFRGNKYDIITVCNKFNEGINVPEADCALMFRPTQSKGMFAQQLGRVLRIDKNNPDKRALFLDFTANAKRSHLVTDYLSEVLDKEIKDVVHSVGGEKSEPKELVVCSNGCSVRLSKKKIELIQQSHVISREEFIEQLCAFAKKLGRTPTYRDCIGYIPVDYAKKLFGGWNNGLREAGLIVNCMRDYDKKGHWLEFKSLIKKLGHVPTYREAGKLGPRARALYGSWNKFLEAHRYRFQQKGSTKEHALLEIKRVADIVGRTPRIKDMKVNGRLSALTIARHFGSWNKALEAAGFGVTVQYYESKSEYIELLKKRAMELGRVPYSYELPRRPIYRFFGSFENALRCADLIPNDSMVKMNCISDVKYLARKLKHPPTILEMMKYTHEGGKYIRISKLFGGWNNVLREAGYSPYKGITKEEYICEIQRIKSKLSRVPTIRDMNTEGRYSSGYAYKFFGSWDNALKASGYDVKSHGYVIWDARRRNQLDETRVAFSEILPETKEAIAPTKLKTAIELNTTYTPKTKLPEKQPPTKISTKKYTFPTTRKFTKNPEKEALRPKILSKVKDGDTVLILESPELLALKEIDKQNKKNLTIIIPNHIQPKEMIDALKQYDQSNLLKNNNNVKFQPTSLEQYLTDSDQKYDFIWMDYCGAFSDYCNDLKILLMKEPHKMIVVATYGLFDPHKTDFTHYFVRLWNFVMDNIQSKYQPPKILEDISGRYNRQMYQIGFELTPINACS